MIICRTPFRISFFGGGTDFPQWYKNNNSIIISGTINKYSYLNVRKLPFIWNFKYRLRYFKNEFSNNVNKIKHGPYREILKQLKLEKTNIEIIHTADLPALSGLGASSSSTVGAINALVSLKDEYLSKKQISELAIKIEQKILKENVGSQDQIATAFGGFNKIEFKNNLDFTVENILNEEKLDLLNRSSLLMYTNIQRKSSPIEKEKINNIENKKINKYLNNIYNITTQGLSEFTKKKLNLKKIGKLLNLQWNEKKKLSSKVSNKNIDKIIAKCIKNGAYGVKLLGSGGGGFIYILTHNSKKKKIMNKFKNYKFVDFRFENSGTNIIYKSN